MTVRFDRSSVAAALLPGHPHDYLGTMVVDDSLLAPLDDYAGVTALLDDDVPLPRTETRGGHSDDRHLEYWLSGWRDARSATEALALPPDGRGTFLCLEGGGCGRVTRHLLRELPAARFFLETRDQAQSRILEATLGLRARSFQTGGIAYLPFSDASVDAVLDFAAWDPKLDPNAMLLEIRRVLRPRGKIYAVVDEGARRPMPRPELFPAHPGVASPPSRNSGRSFYRNGWGSVFRLEAARAGPDGRTAMVLVL